MSWNVIALPVITPCSLRAFLLELDQFIGELQHFGRTRTQIVFSTSVEHRQVTAHEAEE